MSGPYDQKGNVVPRYSRTEDDSASSHSGDKSRRLSLKGMAANVAHKGTWTTPRWSSSGTTSFFGLGLAVQAKVLTDINATSGIQTQAYATAY